MREREREKERNGWNTFQPQNKKGKVILFKFTGDERKSYQVTGGNLIDTFLTTIFTLFCFHICFLFSIWYSITGAGRNTNKSIRIWAGKNKNRIDCIIINLNIKEFDDGMNININTNNINRKSKSIGRHGKKWGKKLLEKYKSVEQHIIPSGWWTDWIKSAASCRPFVRQTLLRPNLHRKSFPAFLHNLWNNFLCALG